MAPRKAKSAIENSETEDFTSDLIRDLNKERGSIVAYNLSVDQSPTHVKRWIPTGIKGLDYVCSNRRNGGLPEGRIIEIFGGPSIGKSHLAAQICRQAQKMGGIAVYIDSETATSVENLGALGVDIRKGFVYVNEHCTEDIMAIAERTILKARSLAKDVPVVIVWDSVAASSPRAELDGEYDKDTIGLQARTISKGMRKITGVIGDQNILFVILNQTRTKIGVLHGDPTVTPGGNAIPFHSSIRIKLTGGAKIENKNKEVVGINVTAKTIKNKVAPPFRTCEFQIHFGVGVKEHEEIFDLLNRSGSAEVDGKIYQCTGSGAWKYFRVFDPADPLNADHDDPKNCILERKFYKANFDEIMRDPDCIPVIDALLDRALIRTPEQRVELEIDENSYIEMDAVAKEVEEAIGDLTDLED